MKEIIKPKNYPKNSFWEKLSISEINEALNVCKKNNCVDYFSEAMNMSQDALELEVIKGKRKLEKLKHEFEKLKLIDYMFVFSEKHNEFILDEHKNANYAFLVQEVNGDWVINTDFFDFTSNNKALKAYNEEINNFNVLLYSCQKGYLNYKQLHRIVDCIENKIELPKKIFYTYLMTDASGYVKIGKALNVGSRLTSLRVGNPTLKIIAKLNKDIEKKLHNLFKYERVCGEWFKLNNDEVLDIINQYSFTCMS